ncbi:hypothetical protein KR084_005372, partial [Drosophila pseudotakahashii]
NCILFLVLAILCKSYGLKDDSPDLGKIHPNEETSKRLTALRDLHTKDSSINAGTNDTNPLDHFYIMLSAPALKSLVQSHP